jgi:superfamily II DNA/RNA helicase
MAFPDAVRALSTTYQRDAQHVVVPVADVASRITQIVHNVPRDERIASLVRILGHHRPDSAVIFCNHRETCDEVARALAAAGFAAVALHGGMEQHDRNTVLLLLRIAAADIGQITVNDRISFVAVAEAVARRALEGLAGGRIKNKRFRAYLVTPPA